MRVIAVPAARAEEIRRRLGEAGTIDPAHRITKRGSEVLIPLARDPPPEVAAYGARIEEIGDLPSRPRPRDPQERLTERLAQSRIPAGLAPRHWERLGDVIVIRLPDAARAHGAAVGRIFGEVLGARTVVEDVSGIHGALRTPKVRHLWGDGTETVHVEGGLRYKLDVARVMFSSGNLAERLRLPERMPRESVGVDLFAGIGYFTLPIAVRARPKRVYACELNPVSFGYLEENLRLNRVTNVVPILGDCRDVAPHNVADWALLGHFDARRYLDVAFRCLRGRGLLVYHELCPREHVPEAPLRRVSEGARAAWFDVERADVRIVKSFAPGIVHVVVEAFVVRRPRARSPPVRAGSRLGVHEGKVKRDNPRRS